MSVMDMWSVCDECGFEYKRRELKRTSYGTIRCKTCHDGNYDLWNHPQNKSAPPRKEPSIVPDGRPQQVVTAASVEYNIRNSIYF